MSLRVVRPAAPPAQDLAEHPLWAEPALSGQMAEVAAPSVAETAPEESAPSLWPGDGVALGDVVVDEDPLGGGCSVPGVLGAAGAEDGASPPEPPLGSGDGDAIAASALRLGVGPDAAPLESSSAAPVGASGPSVESADAEAAMAPRPAEVSAGVHEVLSVLESLAPVWRAVGAFPGYEADAAELNEAVRRLSATASDLAVFVGDNADQFEVCTPWARRMVAAVCADIAATQWVSASLESEDPPQLSAESLKPAVRIALAVSGQRALAGGRAEPISGRAALCVALFKGLTPIARQVLRFEGFLRRRLPGIDVSAERLAAQIARFVAEQALDHQSSILGDDPAATEADRDALIGALVGHVSEVALCAWDDYASGVEGLVRRAAGQEEAMQIVGRLCGPEGPHLEEFFEQAEASVGALVGITRRAIDRISGPAHEFGA